MYMRAAFLLYARGAAVYFHRREGGVSGWDLSYVYGKDVPYVWSV